MKLTLDESQRLNLHFLIGQQRGPVDDIRLCWRMQDRIDLSTEEKERIGFSATQSNGSMSVSWDVRKVHPAEYDFSPEEIARIARIFKDWQAGFATTDRMWLEPLLAQLDNGQPKTETHQ